MELGLDIGPGGIRSATDTGDGPVVESVPPIALPVDESALEAAGLSGESVRTVARDGRTVVAGTTAATVADKTGNDPLALFADGLLVAEDYAEPALAALVDEVLAESSVDSLYFTTPGRVVDATVPAEAHRDAVSTALDDRVSGTTPVSKGFAVVYDQLAADNYTGLGICLERQTTSVALVYYGVPVLSFSIAKGSEWVIERAAETGHATEQVAAVLEEFVLDPDAATGGIEAALARAHDDLVGALVEAIAAEADASDVQEGLAVPIAVAGDGAIEGIEYLVGGRFDAGEVPFSIRGVMLADDPAESAARGALEAAADDVEAYDGVTWGDPASGGDAGSSANTGGAGTRDKTGRSVDASSDDASTEDAQTTLSFDDAMVADHDRTDDAIDQLFDRLANRDDEIRTVSEDVDALVADLESVRERAASAAKVEELEDRLEAIGDELTVLESESATESALEDVSETVARLDEELVAIDDRVDLVDTRVDGVAGRLEEAATRVTGVSERLDELSDRTAEDIGALQDDVGEVNDRAETVETGLAETTETLEVIETGLAETNDALEVVETEVAEKAETIDSIEADLGQTTAALEDVASDVRSLEDDLTTVVASVDTLADESLTDGDLDGIRASIDDLQAAIESVREDLESTAAETSAVDERLEDAETAFRDSIESIEDQITTVRSETEATVEEAQSGLETDLTALAADLETIESDVDALRTERDRLEETVSELQDGDASGADTEKRLDRLATEVDALTSSVASAPADTAVESLERDVSAIESRLHEVATSVDSLDERLAAVDDRFEEEKTDRSARRDDAIAELRSDLQSVRATTDGKTSLSTSVLAGGGGAGVVAGTAVALAGATIVGGVALVLGLALLGIAFFLEG